MATSSSSVTCAEIIVTVVPEPLVTASGGKSRIWKRPWIAQGRVHKRKQRYSDTAIRRHDDTEEKWNTHRREALWWKGYNQPGTDADCTLQPDRDLHAASDVGHMQKEGRKRTKQANPPDFIPTPTAALHQPTMK